MRAVKKAQETYFLKPVVLLFAAILFALSYFFIDLPLTKHFEYISPLLRAVAKKISFLIDADTQFVLWPILYFGFRCLWKKDLWASRCLLIIISVPMTNVIVKVIKVIFGRARPELFFTSGQFGFNFFSTTDLFQSLPSGHACSIGALCGAFACFYPKATLRLFILALLLAFSRVILTEHYFSDIIAGVVIGFIISQWVYLVMKRKNIQFSRR